MMEVYRVAMGFEDQRLSNNQWVVFLEDMLIEVKQVVP